MICSILRMTTFLNAASTTLPSFRSAIQPQSIPNFRKIHSVNQNGVVVTAKADTSSQKFQNCESVPKESFAKVLGVISCGVFAAASVAWDPEPAFADQLRIPPVAAVTPYSQYKSGDQMKVGLMKGRIQACPLDINPNCVSTSSNNAGYGAPWIIPAISSSNASKKIETAILSTQKNPAILQVENTPDGGIYLMAEADGLFGRDVMEFLIKADVVTYRSMAKKVLYLYPFTTPIGDFDAQRRRLKSLEEELGWSSPEFENSYYGDYE